MVLTMYDLSGIQGYVFATNKLKDMIGASAIISGALFDNIPMVLGEQKNDWIDRDFMFDETSVARTVYIGGGNALVMYKSFDVEREKSRMLQKKVFEQSGGALKLCLASIEVDLNASLKTNLSKLMECLEQNKRSTPHAVTVGGFSINAHDNISFEPILLFSGKYTTKSNFLKTERYRKIKAQEKNNSRMFADQFESFRRKGEKNYLAVIHIDGNTMGMKIRDYVASLKTDLLHSLNEMKKLSQQINEVYRTVLDEAIETIYPASDGIIPCRKVIADGDDITIICESSSAFPIVEAFMNGLSDIKNSNDDKYSIIKNFELSAGAGIAFVTMGFPFYTAYDIAEQCCKNAKKITIRRGDSGKSSVDFQICFGGITTDIETFRKSNYMPGGANLALRPYIFGATDERFDFDMSFEKNKVILNSGAARSKLKGLRNAYGDGIQRAKQYGEYLIARAVQGESYDLYELLSEPFYEDGYAKYFDVLDVMDFVLKEVAFDEAAD